MKFGNCLAALFSFFGVGFIFLFIANVIIGLNKDFNPRFDTQQEIEFFDKTHNLFPNGTVNGEGWARHTIWRYIRNNIHSSVFRIKEWDYFATYCEEEKLWVCMTYSSLGYASLYALAVVDLERKKVVQQDAIKLLTLGFNKLPPTSLHDYDVSFSNSKLSIIYTKDGDRRTIRASAPKLKLPNGKVGIDADFAMIQNKTHESMNIQTTWTEDRSCFYLNEKVNGLISRGTIKIGDETHNVMNNSFTVLDWGRGVWTYQNTWYWSSATGMVDDHKVGFNFGYGFSDRSVATENAIFYDNVIHKLDDVTFNLPKKGFMDPWTITGSNGRVNLKFVPAVNRHSNINFILIKSVQNQVFGSFSGTLTLDDGTVINIENMQGFAEKVFNRW